MHLTIDQIPRNVGGKIWAAANRAPAPRARHHNGDGAGLPNIAPYNSFAGLATNPPMLGISFSRRDGGPKNTLANIQATHVFVVNLVPRFHGRHHDANPLKRTAIPRTISFAWGVTPAKDARRCRLPRHRRVSGGAGVPPASAIVALPPSKCDFVVARDRPACIMRDEFVVNEQGFDPLAADLLGERGGGGLYLSSMERCCSLPKTWE